MHKYFKAAIFAVADALSVWLFKSRFGFVHKMFCQFLFVGNGITTSLDFKLTQSLVMVCSVGGQESSILCRPVAYTNGLDFYIGTNTINMC